MSYKPSDAYAKRFTTSSPTTGAAANADSLPVATAAFTGGGTGAMSLTVTNISTGLYEITGTIPSGRLKGEVLSVSVAATCGGIAGKAVVDTQVIDSKRVGDLNDSAYAGGAVASVTAPVTVSGTVNATLVASGLDAITVTEPTGAVSGYNFRQLLRWLVMKSHRASRTPTTLTVHTAAGGTGTTQPVTDDGAGTETMGVAS